MIREMFCVGVVFGTLAGCAASPAPSIGQQHSLGGDAANTQATRLETLLSRWPDVYGEDWSPDSELDPDRRGNALLATDALQEIDSLETATNEYLTKVGVFLDGLSLDDQAQLAAAATELEERLTQTASGESAGASRPPQAELIHLNFPDQTFFPDFQTTHYIEAVLAADGSYEFSVQEAASGEGVAPPALPTAAITELYEANSRMNFVLTRDVLFCRASTNEVLLVPAGFITDFSSIPEAALQGLPENAQDTGAALLHDWLYAISAPRSESHQIYADQIFVEEMGETGTERLRRAMLDKVARFDRRTAVGNKAELKFATPESETVGATFSGSPANAVVATSNCSKFKDNYFTLLRQYGTGQSFDIYDIYDSPRLRQHMQSVLAEN